MNHPPEHFTYRGQDGCALHAASLGDGPPVVLLHGGGPDHHSLLPLDRSLADRYTVVLPDVRGYGRSICADPGSHTCDNYADDVTALLDHLGVGTAVLGGTGLGSSITLRTCLRHPSRVRAAHQHVSRRAPVSHVEWSAPATQTGLSARPDHLVSNERVNLPR